jgi:kynurenine formamidase
MPRLLVFETGVHFIDTFRYLAGEIDEAFARLEKLNPVIQGEDSGILMFRFKSGATGVWDANRFNESNVDDPRYTFGEFLVEGSGGTIRLYPDGRLTLQKLGEKETDHPYPHERRGFAGDCVYSTQRHFIECLVANQPFETSGDEYLKTLSVQEAMYTSASENRPIKISDVATTNAKLSMVPTVETDHGRKRSKRRIVDLSLPIDNHLRGVQITPFSTISGKGWNTTTLSLYSHCGTHMDAPKHFLEDENAATIDQQALEVCCGLAKVVDLTPIEPRAWITVERFQESLIRSRLSIEPNDRLLLRTDWSARFGTPEYRDELPRISLELAHWLVSQQVALIGVEPPSVADVNHKRELTDVHQTLFRGGVVIVEGLVNLHLLQQTIVEFIALPLRIVAGDGSPVRAIAIETHLLNAV